MLSRFLLLFLLAVSGQLSAQIISQFTWESDPFTRADIGPNATSPSTSPRTSAGGAGGTNGLSPGTPKQDLNMTIPNDGRFDVQGIDVAYDYRREESAGSILTRGSTFAFGLADGCKVDFQVEDGSGGRTNVASPKTTQATDGNFHTCRFRYDPNSGTGTLSYDDATVWTYNGTAGRALVWDAGTDLKLGFGIDASGRNIPVLDNLVIQEISLGGLPVVLTVFSAHALDAERVALHWQTDSEWDNDYYAIERSSSSTEGWEVIHRVKGQGNTNEPSTYQVVDRVPNGGTFYYRLRQVDYDGTVAYSAIRSLLMPATERNQVTVYPNPTSGTIWVASNSTVGTVRVVDAHGRDQSVRVIRQRGDHKRISVDLQVLPAGIYTLVYAGGTHRVVKR